MSRLCQSSPVVVKNDQLTEQCSSISFKGHRTLHNLKCRLTGACHFNVTSKMYILLYMQNKKYISFQGLPKLPFQRALQVLSIGKWWLSQQQGEFKVTTQLMSLSMFLHAGSSHVFLNGLCEPRLLHVAASEKVTVCSQVI